MLNDKTTRMIEQWKKTNTPLSLEEWLVERIEESRSVCVLVTFSDRENVFVGKTYEAAQEKAIAHYKLYRSTLEYAAGYDDFDWSDQAIMSDGDFFEKMCESCEISWNVYEEEI